MSHQLPKPCLIVQPGGRFRAYYQPSWQVVWANKNKTRNKNVTNINGNRQSTLKVLHWNPGHIYWINKATEIQHILDIRCPDIMIVLEANIQCEDTDYLTWTPGYNMILTKAMQSMGYSRLVALVREGIQVEVEEQLMSVDVASIWLKVCKQGGRKLYICRIYREHSLLRQHILNNTDEILLQNLYILKWTSPDHQHISMINMVKNDI